MTDLLRSSRMAYKYKTSEANISELKLRIIPTRLGNGTTFQLRVGSKASILSSSSFQILPGVFSRHPRISLAAITLHTKGGLRKIWREIITSTFLFSLNQFDKAIRLLSSELCEEIHNWLALQGREFSWTYHAFPTCCNRTWVATWPNSIPTASLLFCFADIHLDTWSTTSRHWDINLYIYGHGRPHPVHHTNSPITAESDTRFLGITWCLLHALPSSLLFPPSGIVENFLQYTPNPHSWTDFSKYAKSLAAPI